MIRGAVSEAWAWTFHPAWYKEVTVAILLRPARKPDDDADNSEASRPLLEVTSYSRDQSV
jgi:hypothetical protein